MFEMRQSTLDRQDQLEYVRKYGIPDAYESLVNMDKEFNKLQREYEDKRRKALCYIKDMNSFEDKLCKSL